MSDLLLVPAFTLQKSSAPDCSFGAIRTICQAYIQRICDSYQLSKDVVLDNIQDGYNSRFKELFQLFFLYCQWTDRYWPALTDRQCGLPAKIDGIHASLTACFTHIDGGAGTAATSLPVSEIERCLSPIEDLLAFFAGYVRVDAAASASGSLIDWRNSLAALQAAIQAKMDPHVAVPAPPEFSYSARYGAMFSGGSPIVAKPKDERKWQEYLAAFSESFYASLDANLLQSTVRIESLDELLRVLLDFAAWLTSFSQCLKETVQSLTFLASDTSAALIRVDLETSRKNWNETVCFANTLQQL